MISPADFKLPLFGSTAHQHRYRTRRGAPTAGRGKANDVVSGKSHDHQRATHPSASGQLNDRLRAVSRGRCHSNPQPSDP